MALNSRQKRMSALNPACPWRGPLVDAPEAGFSEGNRAAAVFMYSGLIAAVVTTYLAVTRQTLMGVGN